MGNKMLWHVFHHACLAVTLLGFVKMILTSSICLKINICKSRPLGPSSALPAQWVWRLFPCWGWRISKWVSGCNSKRQGEYWKNWCSLVRPLGVYPWLQDATYQKQVQCLTSFAACVRSGRYVRGKQVAIRSWRDGSFGVLRQTHQITRQKSLVPG